SSLKKTEYSDHFSEDRYFADNDRLHRIVFRLKAEDSFLLIKSLYRSSIFDQRYNHIAVRCGRSLLNKDHVSVKDTGVDHAFSLYLQEKCLIVRHKFRRDREVVLYVLL